MTGPCKDCGGLRTSQNTYFNHKAKDRLQSRCKVCSQAVVKLWRHSNPGRFKKYTKTRTEEQKIKHAQYNKEWYAKNPEKRMAYSAKWALAEVMCCSMRDISKPLVEAKSAQIRVSQLVRSMAR